MKPGESNPVNPVNPVEKAQRQCAYGMAVDALLSACGVADVLASEPLQLLDGILRVQR